MLSLLVGRLILGMLMLYCPPYLTCKKKSMGQYIIIPTLWRPFISSTASNISLLQMAADMWMGFAPQMISFAHLQLVEFLLATPVVLWGGWPFFQRGWISIVNRHLNMFTLIALGTGASYFYSVFALLFPGFIPPSFRDMNGEIGASRESAMRHG